MTPDELITRVHRQRAELVAVELAMDTLMSVLTPEQQTKWLQALQSLQTMRTQTLLQSGADPSAIDHANKAIDKRIQRLEFARGQK